MFGIVGTGRIGTAVIERLRAFGCRILSYDGRRTADAEYVELDELLRASDIVSLHVPLDASTHHLLDAGRLALLTLLGLAVAVQVVVLYSPSSHGELLFPQADKVVHVLVFLVPAAVALLAGLRPAAVVALFAAQAVVSEVVQGTLLPARSGNAVDVVADLVGIALGVILAALTR